jgi:hypothetical protein
MTSRTLVNPRRFKADRKPAQMRDTSESVTAAGSAKEPGRCVRTGWDPLA